MIKTLSRVIKQDKEPFQVPKKVQDIIPIRRIWQDGIFLSGKNKYSKTWRFTDINYAVASRDDKEGMFLQYSEILNSLDSGAVTKITINNRRLNRSDFEKEILIRPKGDGLDPYRKTRMDTHVVLPQIPGLPKRSMVEAEQRYAVDKTQIIRYIDKLDDSVMKEVTKALHRSEESDEVTEHRRRSHYRRKKKAAAVAEKKIRREKDGKIDVCHTRDDREGFRGLPNESVRDHSGPESGTEGERVFDRAGESE